MKRSFDFRLCYSASIMMFRVGFEMGDREDQPPEGVVVQKRTVFKTAKKIHPDCIQIPESVALGCQLGLRTLLDRSENFMASMRAAKPGVEEDQEKVMRASKEFENAILHVRKFEIERKWLCWMIKTGAELALCFLL